MKRHELDQFLRHLYQIETFDDYCYNGLQVEGAENIHKILLGVSFHSLLLEAAIREHADAIIVHHGIFGKDFFKIHEPFKKTLHTLLNKNISLFGIHLPMDAHPEIGMVCRFGMFFSKRSATNRQPLSQGTGSGWKE